MFSSATQVMLYVEDVAKASEFWQSIGFVLIESQTVDGTIVVEVAPSLEANLHLVIYDLGYVQSHSPEVNVAAPSIMFYSENIMALYRHLELQEVTLGELMQLEDQMIFNFADPEGNYFAVNGPAV